LATIPLLTLWVYLHSFSRFLLSPKIAKSGEIPTKFDLRAV